MKKEKIICETTILSNRKFRLLSLIIAGVVLVMAGCRTELNSNDQYLKKSVNSSQVIFVVPVEDSIAVSSGESVSEDKIDSKMPAEDPILRFLGKSFEEIKQIMGEPDEQGMDDWFGTHKYILYRIGKGYIRFISPEASENDIVISILLGPGMTVLGVTIGMSFDEISDVWGEADRGPEIGMDDVYYLDYFGGEIIDGVPEFFISFVSLSMDSPTKFALIKWEAFYETEAEFLQIMK